MNYDVLVNYKADGITWRESVTILNAASDDDAKMRAIQHIRSSVPRIAGGVTAEKAQPLNCQGCGE